MEEEHSLPPVEETRETPEPLQQTPEVLLRLGQQELQQQRDALERERAQQQAQWQQRQALLDRREAEQCRRERELATAKILKTLQLPDSFAPWLTGESGEETTHRVEDFAQAFRTAVTAELDRRLAGNPPPQPMAAATCPKERLRGMSPAEINAHWADVQTTLTNLTKKG